MQFHWIAKAGQGLDPFGLGVQRRRHRSRHSGFLSGSFAGQQVGTGPWGLRTDISAGKGYAEQSDVWGLVLMPYYNFGKHIQTVLRYTYLNSEDENGLRLGRYENEIVDGRGNSYNEIYGGLNLFFYGHKFKWQTGLQYTTMDDDAGDGGEYQGWGLSTGLRLSW